MNFPLGRPYRLFPRGGHGLACDVEGVTLAAVPLVRVTGEARLQRYAVRSVEQLGEILSLAYGAQASDAVRRCHRGLKRATAQLEAGDLVLAALEALMIGFPELAPAAVAKLASVADLEKAGTAWQDQPRLPSGQSGGGQWTTEGGGGAPTAADDNASGATPARSGAPADGRAPPLDDGVYRPGTDRPTLAPTGGADEDSRQGVGGNEPPDDFMSLQDVFPALKDEPGLAIPLAPVDSFLGFSGLANEAHLEAATAEYFKLSKQIRALDPAWRDEELQRLEDMTWEGRNNVINNLRTTRAVTYYRIRGDIGPLQVETLRFLQDAVDRAYEDAVSRYSRGSLPMRLSRGEAIGNSVDAQVRQALKEFFARWQIPHGPGQNVTVNNRDVSSSDQTFRVPDARLGKISFDWTLVLKSISDPQIRGFFGADSEPDAVVIVRPSQLGRNSTYLIPRPASMRPGR